MELLARFGIVHKDLSRLKLGTLGISQAQHLVHKLSGALGVQHAERASQEWGESNAEHSSDVTCGEMSGV